MAPERDPMIAFLGDEVPPGVATNPTFRIVRLDLG